MQTLTRATLLAALLIAPLTANAQERVAVPSVRSDTDEVMARLLTRALRDAVVDAEDLRGAGPVGFDWTLRAEIHRASADEDDTLHVSLRLLPADENRDERTLETTMSPNEPPADMQERARSFLDALFGTALSFCDPCLETIAPPSEEIVSEEPRRADTPDWRPVGMWSSIGALAASIGVIIGTQVRLADIGNDPRYTEARDSFSIYVDDVCAENALPGGGFRSAYLGDACAEASTLEGAWSTAVGIASASLVSAVAFFVLDVTQERETAQVSIRASTRGVDVGVRGRF